MFSAQISFILGINNYVFAKQAERFKGLGWSTRYFSTGSSWTLLKAHFMWQQFHYSFNSQA